MFGTLFETILFVALYGISTLFLLFVLIKFWMESKEKQSDERVLHAVTADRWSRYYSGRSGW
jgi:hypothetical protein